ncbi:MAG: ATP-binding protein, partial [Halioglobus sp.]
FAGAVCMPHIFHMTFAENDSSRDMGHATWGLPLFLLLMALPILPILWASHALGSDLPPEYSGLALGMALHSVPASFAAFIAGLSAASAIIIVTTLALANMCLNHLVLPLRPLHIRSSQSIYTQLKWSRRILIFILIIAGYILFRVLGGQASLEELALVSFAGTMQFLPAVVATPYWPGANRRGLLVGLACGLGIWAVSMLWPMLAGGYADWVYSFYRDALGTTGDIWPAAALLSFGVNGGLLIVVSLITRASSEEIIAAEVCSMDDLARPTRRVLSVYSAADFSERLAPDLGADIAQVEVSRAMNELQFAPDESRPYALRRLRARLEANLSGLLGPAVAHRIIEARLPYLPDEFGETEDIYLIERNLERAKPHFTGLAADLDNLRRHHRETLDKLPTGACSIGRDGEVLMWNRSMEHITDIPQENVVGSLLRTIPEPWRDLLVSFHDGEQDIVLKAEVEVGTGASRWVSLHKTPVDEQGNGDTVVLVEDITDLEMLEEELLHNERLASIGRLAAGVAHEIGNPVTGIACLAQNLEYETDPGEIQHMAQDILKQTGRVTRIVESLMNFSHTSPTSGEVDLAPVNLADCVDEATHLLTLDREAKPVRFNNGCDREVLVRADSQRLLQVFVNLLGNARDACDDYGDVRVWADAATDIVRIHVEDNGCGIPPDVQAQVFEPFYTTKDPGEGTGLGLALVYSIMEDMQGRVHLKSPVQEGDNPGTRMTLELPLTSYGPAFEV